MTAPDHDECPLRRRVLEEVAVSYLARVPAPATPASSSSEVGEAALLRLLFGGDDRLTERLFGAAGCLLMVLDVDGTPLRWNAACERLAGAPLTAMPDLATLIDRLVPSDEVVEIRRVLGDVLAGRVDRATVVNHWRVRTGLQLLAWSNVRVELPGRTVIVSVGIEVRDEAVLRPAQRLEGERFRLLAETLPDVVYHFAFPEPATGAGGPGLAGGRLEYINDSVCTLTGYSAADYYADPALGLTLLPAADAESLAAAERSPLGPGPPQLIRLVRRDGGVAWGEHRAVRIRDAAGELVAVQGVVTDVTERVLAERVAVAQSRILESVARGRPLAESREAALSAVEAELPGTLAVLVESGEHATAAPRVVSAPSAPRLVGAVGEAALARRLGPTAPTALSDLPGIPHELREEAVRRGAAEVVCVPVGSSVEICSSHLLVLARRIACGPREAHVLGTFGRLLSIADERDRAGRELQYRARHDDLTGLANRAELLSRLEVALREAPATERLVSVFFCDLDRFKTINDSLGHTAGDALLVAVAERLRRAAAPGDVVARTGGDEFTVIHVGSSDAPGAVAAAGRLVEAMEPPFRVRGRRVYTSMSVGVAVAAAGEPGEPEGGPAGATTEGLVRDADAAMYRAKERGGRRVELFDTIMQVQAQERLELETGLHGALARRELSVDYQPQVHLRTGRVIGAEALLRWRHAGRQVPPADFIPVAEETGLIVPIGAWVLKAACAVAARQSRSIPGFRIGVNLSARQLADPRLTEQVSQALSLSALPARRLCLEVTETTLMDDAPTSLATLRSVHELGVTFAIDDFGTGYSSLLYLKRLPVSVLKIDTTFVRGLGHDAADEAIVASTIQLGHALGRRVVGEGVETRAQQEHLEALGCRYAQGYRFGRPAPPSP